MGAAQQLLALQPGSAQQQLHKVKHTRMVGCGDGWEGANTMQATIQFLTPPARQDLPEPSPDNKLANKVRHPLRLSGPVRPQVADKAKAKQTEGACTLLLGDPQLMKHHLGCQATKDKRYLNLCLATTRCEGEVVA